MSYNYLKKLVLASLACLTALTLSESCHAHGGGILVQGDDGQLVTGYDDESSGNQTIGNRAFTLLFPPSLSNDIPSFLSLSEAPAGSEPLPVGGQLSWDFLPMTSGEITSNLLYWDGLGTTTADVEFGAVPGANAKLTLYTQTFADSAFVDGAPTMEPGKQIGTITGNRIALHAHRWFYLGAASEAGPAPSEGVYLFAMQLRMEGYENSDPFFIAAGTDEISSSTLDNIALPWVEGNLDTLIEDSSGESGDFNADGDVDGADFLVWQRDVGDLGTLTAWQGNYGSQPVPQASYSQAVPEPSSALLAAFCLAMASGRRRRAARM